MFTFSGSEQRIRVCQVVNEWLRATSFPFDLVEKDGPVSSMWEHETIRHASSGQIVLINLISIVWNNTIASKGYGSMPPEPEWIVEALMHLDDDLRRAVGSLIYAMFFGSGAVENWLKTQGRATYPM